MIRRRRPLAPGWAHAQVLAVGHSTHSAEELVTLLQAHGVATLADVRTVPRSRANPQFNTDTFARTLARHGLRYVHLAALGGLRKPLPDSPNGGWRNRSFQGYADYMLSTDFTAGLEQLRREARHGPVALMCAEALRWRCHRSLIADALFARGVIVQHIESRTRTRPHVPTPFARYRRFRVTYPAWAAERADRAYAARTLSGIGSPARKHAAT